jgi:alpha-beta hydrolase superfamily lysophospholipase
MDPALDPSERPCPGCYRGHPAQANRLPGIGRANSLRTWLSMWSLETSKCQGGAHLAKFTAPALVVQSTADMGVFPSDARKIFGAIGATDKTLEMVAGAHYFEDSQSHREKAVELMAEWIKNRS